MVAEAETAGYLNDHCFLPKLTVISQIGLTYILAAGEGIIYLDQHAAHERVLYEYYQALEKTNPAGIIATCDIRTGSQAAFYGTCFGLTGLALH